VRRANYRLLLFLGLAILSPLVSADSSLASSPFISSSRVTHVTSSGATLEAEIGPQGASAGVFYQFQLLHDPGEAPTEIACPSSVPGYSVCVGPQDSGALPLQWIPATEAKDVSLDLATAARTLEAGTTYYYRVLAADRIFSEDTAEWEAPAIFGPTKSFTTPPTGAEALSLTFTEDRANVGVQLSDAAMFTAPDTAPFAAQIDSGTGSITAGILAVPDFATHITEPLDADLNVQFEIGIIDGSFNHSTGALALQGEANATLTSEGKECSVTTTPNPLVLSTAGDSGGANPRSGVPFTHGLTGAGAIAGQWIDMNATPKIPGNGVFVCGTVDERIEGPGGIWLAQESDVVAPPAPRLTSTDPTSPGSSATPRILGSAEPGSTVRLYSGAACAGEPIATATAAELSSPGIAVGVAEGATSAFSATASDAADNTSDCSAPISYARSGPVCPAASSTGCGGGRCAVLLSSTASAAGALLACPPPRHDPRKPLRKACIVPKVVGMKLTPAKSALRAAGCRVGRVKKSKSSKGRKFGSLIVRSSNPPAGKRLPAGSSVNLRVGPKLKKNHR
jgi:hypothetical protein